MKNKYFFTYQTLKTPILAVIVLMVIGSFVYTKWLQQRRDLITPEPLPAPISSTPSLEIIKKTGMDKSPLPLTIDQAKLVKLLRQSVAVTAPPSSTSASVNSPVVTARCSYNGQDYVAGDIINTPQGWLRCSPTFVFLPPNPNIPQANNVAWTAAQ